MENYELTFLISPGVEVEEAVLILEKITAFITKAGGSISRSIKPTKRILAYPIEKTREAFLTDLYFTIEAKEIGGLKENIEKEHNILRHLILKKKLVKEKAKRASFDRRPTQKRPKIELKEIEKKLEEILGE